MIVNNQSDKVCFGCFLSTNLAIPFYFSNKIHHTSLTNQTKFDSMVLCKKLIRF